MSERYFTELGTFENAVDNSKGFRIVITGQGGVQVTSTLLPIDNLPRVLEMIENQSEVFYVWEKAVKEQLHAFPRHSIVKYGIVFE